MAVKRRGLFSEFFGALLLGLTFGLVGVGSWIALPAAAVRSATSPVTWRCQACRHVWKA